jgi:hypothetical protein
MPRLLWNDRIRRNAFFNGGLEKTTIATPEIRTTRKMGMSQEPFPEGFCVPVVKAD